MFPFHRNKKLALEILFHTASNDHPEHGTIVASHKGFGLNNATVRFSIVGADSVLHLDRALFNHILDEAEKAGFVVQRLRSFVGVANTPVRTQVSSQQVREHVRSTPNHQALCRHYEEQRVTNNQFVPAPKATVLDMSGLVVASDRYHPLHPAHPDHKAETSVHPAYPSKGMPYDQFKTSAPR